MRERKIMKNKEIADNLEKQDLYPVTRLDKDREALRQAAAIVRKVESGELVEIVRCGECVKIMTHNCRLCSFSIDDYCTGGPNSDGYCMDGERKDGASIEKQHP
jgi:uncharacterized Fe-S cluster-containing MiaB family protein